MLEKIKRLGTETAIYGVSTVVGRFLTFILTPIYTYLLPEPGALGVVAYVYSYIAFLNVVYGYGMESAYFKYASTLEIGSEKANFSAPFLSLCITSAFFSSIIVWQAEALVRILEISSEYLSTIYFAAAILFLDTVVIIPFARLRLQHKATRFAFIRLVSIVINVACNLLLLLGMKMGVEGIFVAGCISSASTVLMLLPTIRESLTSVFNSQLYKALLRFGLPYVPAGLATMMIQVIDRPILKGLTDITTVGIYQANYRLGIFMMLIVSTFDFAWRPFFLSHAADPEAKPLFARILTYFFLLMMSVFLALTLFLDDIIKLPLLLGHPLIKETYWSGLPIVPVVLLAYVFLGISNNMVAGIYIEKKTKYLPGITFAGVVMNIAANYLLIPRMGIMGAAIATLLSYSVMAIALYLIVRGFYPVQYEFGRMGKITLSVALTLLLYYLVPPPFAEPLWKGLLLLMFVLSVNLLRFFEPAEVRRLSDLFR
jgi:O-antigen/teichoic acid export membrane protein